MPPVRVSLVGFLLLAVSSFAAASEQPTATVTVVGNVAPALQDATYLGQSDPNAAMTIVVGLKRHNEAEFVDLLNRLYDPDSPDYHRWITPTDFLSRFSPSQADVDATRQHLESHGLTVKRVSDNRVLVQATGTVAQIEEALAVNINVYQLGTETHYSNDRNPSVPSSLTDVVESVTGLTSLETMHQASSLEKLAPATVSYTPLEIASIYNFPSRLNTFHGKTIYDGTGETIAIATAYTYLTSDVDYFWTYYYQIERTGTLTNICVNGCTSTLDYEPTLDVEYAGAQAPGANLIVYEVPSNAASDFTLMYSQMASDDSAQVVSLSWGTCENNDGTMVMKTIDGSFAQMAAQGMTIFAGSGDYGAYGYLPSNGCGGTQKLRIGFPPSDPNVTAVGGTTLNATVQYNYKSESAWTDSGGGASTYFAKPKWQVGPGVPTNKKRDIPDIAFDANENTGQDTYYQGEWYSGYGTSYGAPNMAGYWALVLEALKGKSTGNVAPLFYKLGASSSYTTDMHDVTTGNNGAGIGPGYKATKDWDYTTGWGSINGTKALSYFEANP
jgi:kumamolisin